MNPVTNASLADWIVEVIHPFAQDVGSILPARFEAYARVFHPAYRGGECGNGEQVRWAEIAAANRKVAHPNMQFEHTATPELCHFAYWSGWGDPVPLMPLPRDA